MRLTRTTTIGLIAGVAFVACVWLANWAFKKWGIVWVAPGLSAPAAVYFVGVAFTLRDIVHRHLGRVAVFVAIIVGATLSYFVNANASVPGGHVSLAVASGIAFLVSETADLLVYEPTRARGWLPAVALSNIAGLLVDSLLFLWLFLGSLSLLWGQVVGKLEMTALAILVIGVWNAYRAGDDTGQAAEGLV